MMKKRIAALLVLLVMVCLTIPALGETVPYSFNGYALSLPADMYVLTRDNRDVAAAGLGKMLTQEYMDTVFDSQPGLALDAICLDPLYEIFLFQNPVETSASFAALSLQELEDSKSVIADSVQQKGVTLTSEIQVVAHAQTKFYTYTGTAEVNGQVTYILAYVTGEDGFVTTVQLQTYDAPANEELAASFLTMVQNSVFASLPTK